MTAKWTKARRREPKPLTAAMLLLFSMFAEDAYLSWTATQAKEAGLRQRVSGRVGGLLDMRIKKTDHSYNYKLRATWLTPDVIRAAARLEQLSKAFSVDETRRLVEQAEGSGNIILQIEIDPREGSGVIPRQWVATLGPVTTDNKPARAVLGVDTPALSSVPALAGTVRRDFAYEMFWVIFPCHTAEGEPLFRPDDREAELSVRIYDKVGRVHWPVPQSVRTRLESTTGCK